MLKKIIPYSIESIIFEFKASKESANSTTPKLEKCILDINASIVQLEQVWSTILKNPTTSYTSVIDPTSAKSVLKLTLSAIEKPLTPYSKEQLEALKNLITWHLTHNLFLDPIDQPKGFSHVLHTLTQQLLVGIELNETNCEDIRELMNNYIISFLYHASIALPQHFNLHPISFKVPVIDAKQQSSHISQEIQDLFDTPPTDIPEKLHQLKKLLLMNNIKNRTQAYGNFWPMDKEHTLNTQLNEKLEELNLKFLSIFLKMIQATTHTSAQKESSV